VKRILITMLIAIGMVGLGLSITNTASQAQTYLQGRIDRLEERQSELAGRAQSNTSRLDNLKEESDKQSTVIERIMNKVDKLTDDFNEIRGKINIFFGFCGICLSALVALSGAVLKRWLDTKEDKGGVSLRG
jgi:peptidoglycan hydrolase CwlO-like protein